MKKIYMFNRIMILFLCLLIYSNISSINNHPDSWDYIDTFIESLMVSQNLPGVAACAIREGEVIWNGNYGYANISQNLEVDDNTVFLLGSISKTITGIAFLQLYEEGLIDLDDNVNDYLPYSIHHPLYPSDTITPRMLMSHVSGIHDNWNILNNLHYQGGDSPVPLADFIEGYLVSGSIYYQEENYNYSQPGTFFDYSNVGSALIGYLVEILSGESFEQYCQENIFVPLGMTDTSWFLANLNISQIAMPYTWDNVSFNPFGHYGTPMYPCGFLRTSSLHLAQILLVQMMNGTVNNHEILQSDTVELMQTLHYPDIAPEYGLFLQYLNGYWGHCGSAPGVKTRMFFDPETEIGLIVLLNIENDAAINFILEELYEFAQQYVVPVDDEYQILNSSHKIELSNYPNPFNPSTTISFQLSENDIRNVELVIYNLKGQKIKILPVILSGVEGSAVWDGYDRNNQSVSSGVYYYKLNIPNSPVKKMILLK